MNVLLEEIATTFKYSLLNYTRYEDITLRLQLALADHLLLLLLLLLIY